jgi:hypothetical protein
MRARGAIRDIPFDGKSIRYLSRLGSLHRKLRLAMNGRHKLSALIPELMTT